MRYVLIAVICVLVIGFIRAVLRASRATRSKAVAMDDGNVAAIAGDGVAWHMHSSHDCSTGHAGSSDTGDCSGTDGGGSND